MTTFIKVSTKFYGDMLVNVDSIVHIRKHNERTYFGEVVPEGSTIQLLDRTNIDTVETLEELTRLLNGFPA